jgi:nucleoside-diphosphate-sugar epimerase
MSRILVTGATGVIGRLVVPQLVAAGHEVTGVARTPDKRRRLEESGARGIELDLFDPAQVRKGVSGAEVIVNLATAVPRGMRLFLRSGWRGMDRIRREVSANLVGAALAGATVQRLIQESFAPIYADQGDAWIDETAPVAPARYNRSTLDAEAAAERFTRAGRTGVVLRFGFFYGPDDAPTRQIMESVRKGWFPLLGRPEAYTSWISHEDAASAVVAALNLPAGVYNVVEDEPLTRRELAAQLAQVLGVKPPRLLPAWLAPLAGTVGGTMARSLRISNGRLKNTGRWTPKYRTMVAGITDIAKAGHSSR